MLLKDAPLGVQVSVSPVFENYLPALDPAEFALLEEKILAEGVRSPIVVWQGVIVDGHNRYRIAQKHNLLFKVKELDVETEAEAKMWMIKEQGARRNLKPHQRALYIGKLYNELRDVVDGVTAGEVAENLGKQFGESSRNIRRHGELAENLEENPKLKKQYLKGAKSASAITKELKPLDVDKLSNSSDVEFCKAVADAADKIVRTINNLHQYAEDLDSVLLTRGQSIREYAPAIASLHAQLQQELNEAKRLKHLRRAPANNPFGKDFVTEAEYESVTA